MKKVSSLKNRRPIPADPRFEIVFEHGSAATRALTTPSAALRSLIARGGSALGDAYALAARAFLTGIERLEDLRAERRYELRAARASSAPRRLPARLKIAPRPE